MIARETDPLHSQVVSMTRFNTGDNAYNVIPDVVKLGATYRSLTHDGMVRMKKRMAEVGCSQCKDYMHCAFQLSFTLFAGSRRDHNRWFGRSTIR